MKSALVLLAAGAALAALPCPALAQQHSVVTMPGMSMPMPKPATKPKPKAKPQAAMHEPAQQQARPGTAMPEPQPQSDEAPMTMPMPDQPAPAEPMAMPMPGMDMSARGSHAMSAALGSYPVTRESSGTAWQPDASHHEGLMVMSGGWMLMAHGVTNLVYDHQSGPRGDDKTFVSGMVMGMASHQLGNGSVQFRAMLSPDPLMGARGYPLLLATGETADGVHPLADRQHPHDLFMELSASMSQNIGSDGSVFLYGGLPGEPAFGPPAFMHRESILDSPEAPISHHWLDSTHISFGVLTAGLVVGDFKIEASRFNAREPDQHRWDIETGPLDSTSVRLSWNPARTLSLQGSWARFRDPEQLEPGIDQTRWSASALYADDIAPGWHLAATLAWGRKTSEHHSDDGFAAEASLKHGGWTIFSRGELVDNRELFGLAEDAPSYHVGKVGIGAVRDFSVAGHLSLGAGGLVSLNVVPSVIAPAYGGSNPLGTMAFVRLKID